MNNFLTKYKTIIIIIAIIIIVSGLIYLLSQFPSCRDFSCKKVDTVKNELSKKYLEKEDSCRIKDIEIARLLDIIKDSIGNNKVQEQVIKYIKVYIDTNIINQSANQDKKDILKRYAKFYLNKPNLEIYCYDSSVQKQINLTLNDYDYLKSDNKILNNRCELLTKQSNLWESRFDNSQEGYENCKNELQRILNEPKIITRTESNFGFLLSTGIGYTNDFSTYKDLNKGKFDLHIQTGILYHNVSLTGQVSTKKEYEINLDYNFLK